MNFIFAGPCSRWLARRAFGIGCLLLLCGGLGACGGKQDDRQLDRKTLVKIESVLGDVLRTELGLSPETASMIGQISLAPEDAERRLDDHSQAGFERARLIRIDLLNRLRDSPALTAGHPLRRDLAIIADGISRLNLVQQTGQGRIHPGSVRPYVIDPFTGIWREGLYLLMYEHPVGSVEQAEAWLARLAALSEAYDDTRRRLIAESRAGIIPPRALLHESAISLRQLRDTDAAYSELVLTFESILAGVSTISRQDRDRLSSRAREILEQVVYPKHDLLQQTIETLFEAAPQLPGVQSQPNGFELWSAMLAWHAPSLVDTGELHNEQLAEAVALRAKLDEIKSNLPEEYLSLPDEASLFAAIEMAADQTGQSKLETEGTLPEGAIAAAKPKIDSVLTRQPLSTRRSNLTNHSTFSIHTVPASLDGRRPNLLHIHPHGFILWPDWWQTYHLGRHTGPQAEAYLDQRILAAKRTPARILYESTDFKLGWEAYLLSLPYGNNDEPSITDRLLKAKMATLIAALAATDTGMHTQRWSLADSTAYLEEMTGLPKPLIHQLSLQIAASPAEATARLYGKKRFSALEARARAVLGKKFDKADFQLAVLNDGPRPFYMVEKDVEHWYEGQMDQ